ncbi:MAG: thiamine pyrophosphate enzyme-like TPP-binding protein, partial [Chloroflexi bacterium]|nr:thiamine pyrophosphate enzyme-like TPP-binding protein [Chloroflexota bacterium]
MATTQVRSMDAPIGVSDSTGRPQWGSDVVVDMMRLLDIDYAAVLPGSSFRGLHDSAVNYAANSKPELILCNHEMITVSLARGYARAAGKPMAAIVHDFVGLLNTSMSIYDAWCDRTPVIVMGGTGPMDAAKRRPWIDWIHTANLQSNAVREFVKWDDQPWSIEAIPESLLRAYRIAVTEPAGPVYLCYDHEQQEEPVAGNFKLPDPSRFRPAPSPVPDVGSLREAARLLVNAELPLCYADRLGRTPQAVRVLVELAELLAMPVINLGARWSFPTPHALNFWGMQGELLPQADVVLGLDLVDLAGAMGPPASHGARPTEGGSVQLGDKRVINISMDELATRALTTDHQGLPPVDVPMLAEPGAALPLLLEEVRSQLDAAARSRIDRRHGHLADLQERLRARQRSYIESQWDHPQIAEARLSSELWEVVKNEDFLYTSPRFRTMAPGIGEIPDSGRCLGGGGGGAVGTGPGFFTGVSLAMKDSGKLLVSMTGDGEYISGCQALWTAAHYHLPGLWVINNNRSYY